MLLRHRSDRRSLAHVGLGAAALAASLGHSPWWLPVYVLLAVHVVAVEHNHAHLPLFRAGAANAVFDELCAIVCGIPMFCWRIHHVRNHHLAPWTDADWSSPFRFRGARAPDRPAGYRTYQLTYLPIFWGRSLRSIVRRGDAGQRLEMLRTVAVLFGANAALAAAFGPGRWALTVLPAYLACGLALGSVNYFQHWNSWLPERREFAAWTFTCPVHNFLNYNAGYHLLHHQRPGLHWSQLEVEHRRDPGYAPRHLVEPGLFPGYRFPIAQRRWFSTH